MPPLNRSFSCGVFTRRAQALQTRERRHYLPDGAQTAFCAKCINNKKILMKKYQIKILLLIIFGYCIRIIMHRRIPCVSVLTL